MINIGKGWRFMIKITDNNEVIELGKDDLKEYDKYFEGLVIKPVFDYWLIELILIFEDNYLKKIIKIYNGGDEVLDKFVSKLVSKDTIVLSEKDFKRFKKLYTNMRSKKNYRKEAIISAYAELLSYEYYQSSVLEDCVDISMEDIFGDLNEAYDYFLYHDEIMQKSREILKEKYSEE